MNREKTDRSPGRLGALPRDLQRRRYRRFPKVPVLPRIVVVQKLEQSRDVDVIVVVKVTEPPAMKNTDIEIKARRKISYNRFEGESR